MGPSVIDFCCVTSSMIDLVQDFAVRSKIYSDHMPIEVILRYATIYENVDVLRSLPKYAWSRINKENYVRYVRDAWILLIGLYQTIVVRHWMWY